MSTTTTTRQATHYLRGYCEQRAKTGPIRFVATSEGKMGDGLDLRMSGARLDRYRANPIVGYGHSYSGRDGLPIGRSIKTFVDGPRLMADVEFDQADEFAVKVERKYRDGFLNAVSIGFGIESMDHKTGVVDDWELFEISSVPIPMDPSAVVAGGRGILTAAEFRALMDSRARTVDAAAARRLLAAASPVRGADGLRRDVEQRAARLERKVATDLDARIRFALISALEAGVAK